MSLCRYLTYFANATASGFTAATRSRARTGPSGRPRPCSQFCKVEMLTPIMRELRLRLAQLHPNRLHFHRIERRDAVRLGFAAADASGLTDALDQILEVLFFHPNSP